MAPVILISTNWQDTPADIAQWEAEEGGYLIGQPIIVIQQAPPASGAARCHYWFIWEGNAVRRPAEIESYLFA